MLRPTTHASADQALADVAASYRRQLWRDQDADVHVLSVTRVIVRSNGLPYTARGRSLTPRLSPSGNAFVLFRTPGGGRRFALVHKLVESVFGEHSVPHGGVS